MDDVQNGYYYVKAPSSRTCRSQIYLQNDEARAQHDAVLQVLCVCICIIIL
jgi:hypothetical protein